MTQASVHCNQGLLSFDIFCRVIDNYGDVGVCWRLARQLAQQPFGHNVRLWVDDLGSFKRLEPSIHPSLEQQRHLNVDVIRWHPDAPRLTPHAVVIEAFGCTPPQTFIDAMVAQDSLWLNLEYLSAEPWVEGFHLQPSIQTNGLRKSFFFPGFTCGTGGLLREHQLVEQRIDWQSRTDLRNALLQSCGLSGEDITAVDNGAHLVFVFCYPDAPVSTLVKSLASAEKPSLVMIPEGTYSHDVGLPGNAAPDDAAATVRVRRIPFVSQPDFDRLLWSCDLNIVRGEDSMVRALWAARPMIWQPYRQDDDVHITKLDAWLARSPLASDTQALIRSWTLADVPALEKQLLRHQRPQFWERWMTQAKQWSRQLEKQDDLATSLVQFCTQKLLRG